MTALRFGHQAFAIAQQMGDPELLPYAHQFLGWSLVWHGRFREAIQHFQEAIARSDPVRSAAQRAFYGFDIKAVTLRWLSYALLAAVIAVMDAPLLWMVLSALKAWLGGEDPRFIQVPYPDGFRQRIHGHRR